MIKRITAGGILTTAAIICGYIEYLLPLSAFIPIPGIKLGLANVVVTLAVLYAGKIDALSILILKCLLTSLLFGSVTSFAFSIAGGLFALTVTVVMLSQKGYGEFYSVTGVSVASAASHNTGQILTAAVIFSSSGVIAYLPVLLFASVITGLVTGMIIQRCGRIFSANMLLYPHRF